MKKVILLSALFLACIFTYSFRDKSQAKSNIVKVFFDRNSDTPCDKSPEKKDYSGSKTITDIASRVINQSKIIYLRSFSGYDEDNRQELMDKRTDNIKTLLIKAGVDEKSIISEYCQPKHIDLPVKKAAVDTVKSELKKEKLLSSNRFTEVKILTKK